MSSIHPKKMIALYILQILKKHTDANHTLSQKKIQNLLNSEYDMPANRKTIKDNLMDLETAGYKIHYKETERYTVNKINGDKEDTSTLTDFYLEQDFTDGELRLLVDSVLSSKNISPEQSRQMIKKIENLSNKFFHANVKHVQMMSTETPVQNKELFHNIETISEAIQKKCQVSFNYNSYGTDFMLHPRTDNSGNPRSYVINPYQMAVTNSRYYLICNYANHDNITHCRIDRITNIRILNTPVRNYREIEELKHGFNFPKHMTEHIYMFCGPSSQVRFIAKKTILNDIIDWFGNDLTFITETEDTVTVSVYVNEQAMIYWSMQYAAYMTVIAPKSLRERVKKNLENALSNYGGSLRQ